MIPWIVAGVAVAAYGAYKALSSDDPPPRTEPNRPSDPLTEHDEHRVLKANVRRLRRMLEHQQAKTTVAVIGQPGAGKSSLIIKMCAGRCVPLPVVGVETDATDWSQDEHCALECVDGDMLFVDFPGHGTRRHPVGVLADKHVLEMFDVVLFVWRGKFRAADEKMLRCLSDVTRGTKVIGVRSACDDMAEEERPVVMSDWTTRAPVRGATLVFCSNRTGEGVDACLGAVAGNLSGAGS